MNEEFKRNNLDITINKDSVYRYLKAEFENQGKFGKYFT